MSKKIRKFSIGLVITCFAITFISLTCFITNVYAVNFDEQLKIEYEGTTKIVSNIQNYLNAPQKSRSALSYDNKIDTLLNQLGLNPKLVPDSLLNSLNTARTVYSNEFFPTAVDQKFYFDDEFSMVFMVLDNEDYYEGEHYYTLYAQAYWNTAYPLLRNDDAICFAYAGGNVMGANSDYSMIYTKNNETITVPRENISELSMLPYFGVLFDLPPMINFVPLYSTKEIGMFVTQVVTATSDFVANCSYAHSNVKVTPSIGVNISQDEFNIGINFTFGEGIKSYCPGLIRVHVK